MIYESHRPWCSSWVEDEALFVSLMADAFAKNFQRAESVPDRGTVIAGSVAMLSELAAMAA